MPASTLPPRIISADSHVTEPPDTYTARIDPKYRDDAPHIVHHDEWQTKRILHDNVTELYGLED